MKIVFLGTNGWYDTKTGNTPCVFVESQDRYVIFDAGFGFYKAKDRVTEKKPVTLFISHLHLDHLVGLHTLPLFKFPQGIDVYAPKAVINGAKAFLRRPYTSAPLMLPTRLRFHEIDRLTHPGFALEALRLRHSVPCFGYRITLDGKAITYCTDTGLCANLKRLARGADVLITECAMSPGDRSPNLFHITPETAARIAAAAGARRLALFHFDPGKYPTLAHRGRAEEAARALFKETIAARDGTIIKL